MRIKNVLLALGGLSIATIWAPSANAGLCSAGPKACNGARAAATSAANHKPTNTNTTNNGGMSLVAPINTTPGGQTYGRWAAQWWQWALSVPDAVNPLKDVDGKNCAARQIGDVWFLAGSTSSDSVERSCTIPAGKSIFFPIINQFYAAFLNDPPETQTDDYARAAAACTTPVQISMVSIDNVKLPNPTQFFTGPSGSQSPLFNIQLPPNNIYTGIYDIPELLLRPTAEQGYYLFVNPLSVGRHTIRWIASGCTEGFQQDIKYNLTVQ